MTTLEDTFSNALIVDDDPILLEVGRAALMTVGIANVETAGDGQQALEKLASSSHPFDLVLTDIEMPVMDGMALLRNLSTVSYKGAVVVLSSLDKSVLNLVDQLGKSHEINFLGVLAKPVSVEKLNQVLAKRGPQKGAASSSGEVTLDVTTEQLAQAIEAGAIVPYFQAKYSIDEQRICGAEALARWQDETLGFVSPGLFIPIAEKNGLIKDLTWKLLDQSLAFAKTVRQTLPTFAISVNLPTEMVGDLETPERLSALIAEQKVAANSLILEITEGQLLEATSSALEVFGRLRVMGVGLAIDDFGTGHANLSVLRTYPFTELKIDRSIIIDIDQHPRSQAMVSSCVSLARDLQMSAVAEGIETREEMQTLADLGVETLQGYFISKPIPALEFASWLKDFRPPQ
ncbi:MAG: EAL domain-containing response regulator [Filomicrobium sp.]